MIQSELQDVSFAARYSCDLEVGALPSGAAIHRVCERGAPPRLVELATDDDRVFLELGGSTLVRASLTGWHSTPSPDHAFVVVNGRGYWVDTRMRNSPSVCPLEPIRSIIGCDGPACLLVASPWELAAYDVQGLKWRSARLAIDGFQVRATDGQRVLIEEDLGDGSLRRAEVDLLSGRATVL